MQKTVVAILSSFILMVGKAQKTVEPVFKFASGKPRLALIEFQIQKFCRVESPDSTYEVESANIVFHLYDKNKKEIIEKGKTLGNRVINLRNLLVEKDVPHFDSLGNMTNDVEFKEDLNKEIEIARKAPSYDVGAIIEKLKSGDKVEFKDIIIKNMVTGAQRKIKSVEYVLF